MISLESVIVLKKCPRGWKCGSADFDEACFRSRLSEIIQMPSWFCSVTFISNVLVGVSHLGPPKHEKSCF